MKAMKSADLKDLERWLERLRKGNPVLNWVIAALFLGMACLLVVDCFRYLREDPSHLEVRSHYLRSAALGLAMIVVNGCALMHSNLKARKRYLQLQRKFDILKEFEERHAAANR